MPPAPISRSTKGVYDLKLPHLLPGGVIHRHSWSLPRGLARQTDFEHPVREIARSRDRGTGALRRRARHSRGNARIMHDRPAHARATHESGPYDEELVHGARPRHGDAHERGRWCRRQSSPTTVDLITQIGPRRAFKRVVMARAADTQIRQLVRRWCVLRGEHAANALLDHGAQRHARSLRMALGPRQQRIGDINRRFHCMQSAHIHLYGQACHEGRSRTRPVMAPCLGWSLRSASVRPPSTTPAPRSWSHAPAA